MTVNFANLVNFFFVLQQLRLTCNEHTSQHTCHRGWVPPIPMCRGAPTTYAVHNSVYLMLNFLHSHPRFKLDRKWREIWNLSCYFSGECMKIHHTFLHLQLRLFKKYFPVKWKQFIDKKARRGKFPGKSAHLLRHFIHSGSRP